MKWKYKDISSERRNGNDARVFGCSGSCLYLSGSLPAKKATYKDEKNYWRSFKGRRPLFVTIEMVMLAAFLVLIFVIPPAYASVFMFLFFFLLYVLRGFEEWKFERNQKEHYHSWFGATFFLFGTFILVITDM
ncbi:DUF4181 domain-containing protein [Priestia aryabhattai]|uniref:DUF4181 domain-containing protein n=1 Tax=Priestia aryabhattai TaxID=412384 RepID=UPI00203C013A|nr:DUF4181 domain-containing protein [Priestia aryabhattai]MCM3770174.1 DUF4181 domain-containing protein [Priestia aryabhattai]